MLKARQSKTFIYISLGSDLVIAFAKFIAAAFTGSASMFSEGIHSVIDAFSQILLIWGTKTSKKQADQERPFGYGKEQYFWSFIVSLLFFVMGGCVTLYEGIHALKNPVIDGNPGWSYMVLVIALLFTLVSVWSGLTEFRHRRGKTEFWKALFETRDPSTIIVILGDFGDVLGILIAAAGIFFARLLHNPYYDGIASIVIGLILVTISGFLVRQSKHLLMGQTTRKDTLQRLKQITEADTAILEVRKEYTMYMSPDEVVFQADAIFKPGLSTRQITNAIQRIRKAVQTEYPMIKQINVQPTPK
jgi:cation diffusion facilitator family transporter